MLKKVIHSLLKNSFSKEFDKIKVLNAIQILENRSKHYNSINNLNEIELKVFSQNGEDGIIHFLLTMLDIKKPNFVELGIENFTECNTRLIYETMDCNGLLIDGQINKQELDQRFEAWRGNIQFCKSFIDKENINEILKNYNLYTNLDLFSIDIDGNDYWIIDQLKPQISKIFIAEYNPLFGYKNKISVPYNPNFERTKEHYSNLYFGASLPAIIDLLDIKGYDFIGVNSFCNNAFFVSKEESKIFKTFNFEINNQKNMKYFTDNKFLESRNKNGELTYMKKREQVDLIKELKVVDLEKNQKIKIKELNL